MIAMGSIVPAVWARENRVLPGPCRALDGVLDPPAVFGAAAVMRDR